MQDGNQVRVLSGKFTGKTGELVGEPSRDGICVKFDDDPIPNSITSIHYPPGTQHLEQFLELIVPPDLYGGTAPQPA